MNIRYISITIGLALGALSLFSTTSWVLAEDPSFVAELTVELCPEYPEGGVVLDMVYTVGQDPTLKVADVVSQNIDTDTNQAKIQLRFPSFFGTLPFHVSSSCRNARGFSIPSNVVSFSNCDVLATRDTDADGISDNLEDTNCDNFFSPGDASNLHNVDTDGDGVRDLVERLAATDPTNPASSPRPNIISAAVFDPDGNGDANAVAWRGTRGTWFIKDFTSPGQHLSFNFGLKGDIPIVYQPEAAPSNVAVVRRVGTDYHWFFRGPGILGADTNPQTTLRFGIFGDNIIPGSWEKPGVTNPAVARLFNGVWTFIIYQQDGSARSVVWGGNGDIPKPQDFDGDGILDVAVYRPSEQKTYWISSISGLGAIEDFGSGTAEHTVRGDFSGDGKEEITVWEPNTGVYSSLVSDNGFDSAKAMLKDPDHYFEMQLGLYNIHLPMNWNRRGGLLLYTVIDHAQGLRYWRTNNAPDGAIIIEQWGLQGDHLG